MPVLPFLPRGNNSVERTLEQREKRCSASNYLSTSVIPLPSTRDAGKKRWRRLPWENLFLAVSSTRLNQQCTIKCFPIWRRSLTTPGFHLSPDSVLDSYPWPPSPPV